MAQIKDKMKEVSASLALSSSPNQIVLNIVDLWPAAY